MSKLEGEFIFLELLIPYFLERGFEPPLGVAFN
jgi:hypothetical protein